MVKAKQRHGTECPIPPPAPPPYNQRLFYHNIIGFYLHENASFILDIKRKLACINYRMIIYRKKLYCLQFFFFFSDPGVVLIFPLKDLNVVNN